MCSKIPTVCLVVSLLGTNLLGAQSLAGVAQQEEERRKAIKTPAKVITDKDLQPAPSPSPDTRAASAAPSSPANASAAADNDKIAVAAAQYRSGALPQIPVVAVSGGEVLLELTVGSDGQVVATKALRHTPPFTNALQEAVLTWQFRPAEDADVPRSGELVDPRTRKPVESKVLVAAMFRPPAFYATTLGEPPKDVAAPSDAIPFPLSLGTMPLYPPLAVSDGVVLAELRVGPDGRLVDTAIVHSTPPFDQPTLNAVQQWAFRAARVHGRPVAKFVYVVAAFRSPVAPTTNPGPPPNRPTTP